MRIEALSVQEALYAEENPLCGEEAERRLHCVWGWGLGRSFVRPEGVPLCEDDAD